MTPKCNTPTATLGECALADDTSHIVDEPLTTKATCHNTKHIHCTKSRNVLFSFTPVPHLFHKVVTHRVCPASCCCTSTCIHSHLDVSRSRHSECRNKIMSHLWPNKNNEKRDPPRQHVTSSNLGRIPNVSQQGPTQTKQIT